MANARPHFKQINIVSSDMAASIAFYRRLGADIPEERVWGTASGMHHASSAENTTGADLLLDSVPFAAIWNSGWQGRKDLGGRVVADFAVATREEVDRIYGDLTAAGHMGLQPPYDAFWGARYAVVEDPAGLAIGLISPISDDKRSARPEV
jgi:uncharacterized glyoxalase superfamily protein PhnB